MKTFSPMLLVLLFLWTTETEADTDRKEISSCVTAQPKSNFTSIKKMCRPYKYPIDGYCRHILKNSSLYGSEYEQDKARGEINCAVNGKEYAKEEFAILMSESCVTSLTNSYCRWAYPKCDQTSDLPLPKLICRETCEDTLKTCESEIRKINYFTALSKKFGFPNLSWNFVNCSTLQYRNGGSIPGCYYSSHLNSETDKLEATACYYGNGLGYRGNVSVTRSGLVCQTWSSQCPHRHDYPLNEYPELVNASNWCRNPGGQATDGPWCYTTNSSIRWEYCDVEKCPPPAPSQAPLIVEAYASGPSKISIKWKPVPSSFIHGQHRGFRVRICRLDQDPITTVKSPGATDAEFKNLQALTNYRISVSASNFNGEGPSSSVYVKTLPKDHVAFKYTLTLNKRATIESADMEKRLSLDLKTKISKLLQHKKPTRGFRIHELKVALSNGSKHVEFLVTAELTGRPSWYAVQDMTGRISRSFEVKTQTGEEFLRSSLLVQAPPPPPANLSKSDVKMTSVTVDWSTPLYHGPYIITNYIVQYKKADTEMPYYDARTVNSEITKVKLKNLVSNAKYLMRVLSVNVYGAEASETMEVKTQDAYKAQLRSHTLPTVLPISAILLVGVITGVIFLRWRYKKQKEIQEKLQKLRENPQDLAADWFAVLKIKITKQWWEIPRDDLLLDEELGSGSFGVVMKGYLTKREEDNIENHIVCAVKTLKDNPTQQELRDLCNGINIMSSVGDHPNLVSVIGACTVNGPPWLVVRFAPNGCLLDYLKENRPPPEYQNKRDLAPGQMTPKPISERERMRFAHEIAQGMAHLERHKFVHRDLAARNVLLGKNMVAMVSDFSLSRDICETEVYEKTAKGFLPVRWMALESLRGYTYDSKSDVWSYGIILWEIECSGLMPYAGMSGIEIVQRLRQGYRLERPQNTSRDMYEIMWECWNPDPNQRPTFADLVYNIGGLVNLSKDFHQDATILKTDAVYFNRRDVKLPIDMNNYTFDI